jgi:hypothetical protein
MELLKVRRRRTMASPSVDRHNLRPPSCIGTSAGADELAAAQGAEKDEVEHTT